jgi:hypothetical protein
MLAAQAAADAQQRGRPGALVDPRPETVDGEVKIVITPQLVHDIFEEYPVVATVYAENVPNEARAAPRLARRADGCAVAVRSRVLDALFPEQALQRAPRVSTLGRGAACCPSGPCFRSLPREGRRR